MRQSSGFLRLSFLVPVLLILALLLVPTIANAIDEPFYVRFFARMLVYAIAAMALNIALGLGGLVSLGHALFLGLGAYSVAIPGFYEIDNGLIHLILATASCAAIGWLTGAISLRTSGIAFIMITLAFAQMGYFVFVSLKHYGGDDGTAIVNTSKFFGLDLGQSVPLYYVALFILLLMIGWTARLRQSPFGMVIRGAKQNSRRTSALGFATRRYQLLAYVISAVITGIAGMLLANLYAFASPGTLSWVISGDLIVMVILGGMGTVAGPLLGAISFLGLEEVLKLFTEHWMVIFGPVILLVALVGKGGLVGLLNWCDSAIHNAVSRRSAAKQAKAQGETL